MLGLVRLSLILLVVQAIVFTSLFLYLRAGIKMRLEEDWVMEGRPGDQEAWIDERMEQKVVRLRRWLALIVFVVPIAVLTAIVLVTN